MLSRFALMAGEPADNDAHHARLHLSMPYRIWCGVPYLRADVQKVPLYGRTEDTGVIMKILASSQPSSDDVPVKAGSSLRGLWCRVT